MAAPRFAVVSPVFNVAKYLPGFLESLERQSIGMATLEIILVDDGSTDDSLTLCAKFAKRYPKNVRVLQQSNSGQAAAKNVGLAAATADWISFLDPDDFVSDNFFEAISSFMDNPESSDTALFGAHLIPWHEAEHRRSDNHSTSFRFAGGNATVDLVGKPNFLHSNGPVSVFRRDILVEHEIQFDERLRTRFEDASFMIQFLLVLERPVIGLVDDARYFHRMRDDGFPNVPSGALDPRTFTDVPAYGYLGVLEKAIAKHGQVPKWVQWFIVYDIILLFKSDVATSISSRRLPPESLAAFHEALADVLTHIKPEVILGFDVTAVPQWMREALTYGYQSTPYVGPVYVGPPDEARDLIRLRYRFTGACPTESVFVKGKRIEPRFEKIQTRSVLGRVVLKERSLWVSSLGVIRLEIDGQPQRLNFGEPTWSEYKLRRVQILQAIDKRKVRNVPKRFRQVHERMNVVIRQNVKQKFHSLREWFSKERFHDRMVTFSLRAVWVRKAYAGAWALLDREFEANDSAEEFYRWLRDNKPQVKVWFVLQRDSADWKRLQSDGFKLIELGSYRWKLLMLLAGHVISSHATAYITNPLPAERYGRPQWKFTFLQHGVIKGDLSRWLNKKEIEVFVTSTNDEYQYISGESPYKFGPKEVRLTGLPRHDALLKKSEAIPADGVDQILIAPTWREFLAGKFIKNSVREKNPNFMTSEFAQSWQALVCSPALRDLAEAHGHKVVFIPHPNIQPYLEEFTVPDWVEIRLYGDVDVQEVVARSSVMITDYSSQAFNMAYLYRPVIYFQFDQARYDAEHTEGKGYFDYDTHGFGPVQINLDGVIESLDDMFTEPKAFGQYFERMEETFPVRDGKNSERVYKAIQELDRPLSFKQASVTAAPEVWPSV